MSGHDSRLSFAENLLLTGLSEIKHDIGKVSDRLGAVEVDVAVLRDRVEKIPVQTVVRVSAEPAPAPKRRSLKWVLTGAGILLASAVKQLMGR